jgi:serine/threonine protein kinase
MVRAGQNFQSGRHSIGADTYYRKVRKLGEGGMAETYLCVRREPGEPGDPRTRKTTIEDRLCCKRLHWYSEAGPEFDAAAAREAAIVASLRHSNIAILRDWDLVAGELYFELIDGCDLRQLVAAVTGGRLAAPLVTLIGIELGKALAYAHSRTRKGKPAGIVHRDISPSNVMISYAGEVKLTDFGLAVVVALEQRDGEPMSGFARGKLAYMAPEQARTDRFADHRVDLFSLGVVLYELIAGRRPAIGSDDEVYAALSTGQHPPLRQFAPEVPLQLEQIVERLLHPNPARRFQNADDAIDALTVLAPPHNLFRELGVLASRAVPPQTVTFRAFSDEHEPSSELAAVPSPSVNREGATTAPHQVALTTSTSTRLNSLEAGEPEEARADDVHSNAPSLQRRAKRRTMVRRVGGVAALAAGAAIVLTAQPGVGTKSDREPATSVALLAPDPQPSAVLAPAAADSAREDATSEPGGPVEAPPLLPAAAPPKTARAELANATLRIGVVPIAQVWVDGRYLGWSWSPISVKLEPGVEHIVAAGEHKSEITRRVRLEPGERSALTLHLPK